MNIKINFIIFFMLLTSVSWSQFNTVVNKNGRKIFYSQKSNEEKKKSVDTIMAIKKKDNPKKQIYFSLPLDTIIVNSDYGYRLHPVRKKRQFHKGIDLKARSNYVYSVMPGKVLKTGKNKILGNYVRIQHGKFESLYAHLNQILINKKEIVTAGKKIGITGNTGRSTGEHLHFGMKYDDKPIDPKIILEYINKVKNNFKILER